MQRLLQAAISPLLRRILYHTKRSTYRQHASAFLLLGDMKRTPVQNGKLGGKVLKNRGPLLLKTDM